MKNLSTKMAPNGPVLQPAEVIYIFWKRTPDTLGQLWCDGMVWYKMTWYGMVTWYWYGAHITPGMGTLKVPQIKELMYLIGTQKWVTEVAMQQEITKAVYLKTAQPVVHSP